MADKQGQRLRELPLCILILLVIVGITVGASNKEDCSKTQYRHDGVCCDKCALGHKLIKKCSSGMKTTCEKCTNGTYQDNMNYFPNCFRCMKCSKRKHAVVISPCTYQNNTVCGCQPGYRMRVYGRFSWDCVPHKNAYVIL
ncbi:tumor necrosis factor receptor superfamily member 1A-like [Xyrauchen texanus]|uniref:tumor necrosis factor receptor superfamily member 1A-like n=1 Tax=Xyrauchen texanus TaxID=154827 RepID=UPI002241C804|nr:tumor necrosis factor receptor superfamily member 1A-like [Xyrauchen texanus]